MSLVNYAKEHNIINAVHITEWDNYMTDEYGIGQIFYSVSLYEILDTTGSGPYGEKNPETLKRLYFEDDLLGVGADDPKYVEYYFDIQVDNEIDSEEFCSLKIKNNKIESIYVDDTFVCPDKTPSPTVSLNIYGTKENQDIEVC